MFLYFEFARRFIAEGMLDNGAEYDDNSYQGINGARLIETGENCFNSKQELGRL